MGIKSIKNKYISLLCFLAALALAGSSAAAGRNLPRDLFDALGNLSARVPERVNLPPKVMGGRNRLVQAHLDLIQADRITLNLFDDTVLIAERERIVDNAKGCSAWIGHVQGEPDSEVICRADLMISATKNQ